MMSKEGLKLQVGDSALTDYRRGTTRVRIIERIEGTKTQSGVCYRVLPPLDLNHPEAMFDSDWFEPVPQEVIHD